MAFAKVVTVVIASIAVVAPVAACGDNSSSSSASASSSIAGSSAALTTAPVSPQMILSSTAWQTTAAVDNTGKKLELTDPNAKNYVGYAYFRSDGTFRMFNVDDTPKMHGDWKLSADGKTRIITAKDDSGKVTFVRESPIVTLTAKEFTYRTFPDATNKSVYVDIIHTPTTHAAPTGDATASASAPSN